MSIYPVKGIKLGSTAAGIRYKDRDDLVVMQCLPGTTAAGVFTRNRFCAAPVHVAKQHLSQTTPRALVINAGNANAGTGEQGMADALSSCEALANRLDVSTETVLPFSTGVIGERLAMDVLTKGLDNCIESATDSADAWQRAALAIMTTDTVPKLVSSQVLLGGKTVTVTGIAKGAGMIRPDMATMLAFIATDATIDSSLLQAALDAAVNASFNRITVDGDTSTNDACMLLATGASGIAPLGMGSNDYELFVHALNEVMQSLAKSIIRDAEGATKFITINVAGGSSEQDCLAVAYTVAESPLVKTAMFASDPNWGRILAAVGRARVAALDIQSVSISINDVAVITNGEPDPGYTEAAGQEAVAPQDIDLSIAIGSGEASTTVWTSDLSHEYVTINAEYRT